MIDARPLYALLGALIVGAIALGGGLYETILIDRSWPRMPEMIQPQRGGINRGMFWGPVHGLFEVTLLVALWLAWTAFRCAIEANHRSTGLGSAFALTSPSARSVVLTLQCAHDHAEKLFVWIWPV
jgi:hypothetical protein